MSVSIIFKNHYRIYLLFDISMISHDEYLGKSMKRVSNIFYFGTDLHSPRLFKGTCSFVEMLNAGAWSEKGWGPLP